MTEQLSVPGQRSLPDGIVLPLLAVGIAVLGLLLSKTGPVIVAAPLVLALVWAKAAPPPSPLEVATSDPELTREGGLTTTIAVAPDPRREFTRLRIEAVSHRPYEVLLAGSAAEVTARVAAVRTGPQQTFRVDGDPHGVFGFLHRPPVTVQAPDLLVLPTADRLGLVPTADRLRGVTGPRDSRRAGSGLELRDVHAFAPGDVLRRIDWRSTARQADIDTVYVRGTYADAEATAMLIVDSRDEVGPDLHTWRGIDPVRADDATSLDIARHAAASYARALLRQGDRVGLIDLASGRFPVPAATGDRQFRRLLHGLALAAPVGSPVERVRAPRVPAGAIVYLFTTLLDDVPVRLARQFANTGHRVIVVDTLPPVRPAAEAHVTLAWRITAMEREDRRRTIVRRGVPVLAWATTPVDRIRVLAEAMVLADRRHRRGGLR